MDPPDRHSLGDLRADGAAGGVGFPHDGAVWRVIYLPALRTHFSSGMLTAFGLAWKSGVAAEVICPPDRAIGSRIQQAKLGLETPELFAWTLTIVALSLTLEGLLRRRLEGVNRR